MAKIKLYVDILPSEPVPAGTYLVHDRVRPVAPLGLNSFRASIRPRRKSDDAIATSAAARMPSRTNFIIGRGDGRPTTPR